MRRCQRRRAPSWRRGLRLREVARWAARAAVGVAEMQEAMAFATTAKAVARAAVKEVAGAVTEAVARGVAAAVV